MYGFTDQWKETGRQPVAFNQALLWSFQPGNPIGTVNRATTPSLGLGTPSLSKGTPTLGLGTPSLGLGSPSLGLGTQAQGGGP